jgi:hypothetical protein
MEAELAKLEAAAAVHPAAPLPGAPHDRRGIFALRVRRRCRSTPRIGAATEIKPFELVEGDEVVIRGTLALFQEKIPAPGCRYRGWMRPRAKIRSPRSSGAPPIR